MQTTKIAIPVVNVDTQKRSKFFVAFLAIIIFLIDRLTKNTISQNGSDFSFGPLSFIYATNTGAAFNFLEGHPFFLKILSVILFFVLIYIIWYHINDHALLPWFFGFMLGGALGNLYDRFVFGFVVDFIKVPYWPAFNIADSALTVGVVGALIVFWMKESSASESRKKV